MRIYSILSAGSATPAKIATITWGYRFTQAYIQERLPKRVIEIQRKPIFFPNP
jgi:hypothetical protein